MGDSDEIVERILAVLRDNPAYRDVYGPLVRFCGEEQAEEAVLARAAALRTAKNQLLGPSALVAVMERAGALARTVLVDGVPYEGGREALQADESIPEDAVVASSLQATPEGLRAVDLFEEPRSLSRLCAEAPGRAEAFRAVLAWCAEPGGASTRALQERLREAAMLETEADRAVDGLHASYFTGALESIGALAWNGKAWVATDKGRASLAR